MQLFLYIDHFGLDEDFFWKWPRPSPKSKTHTDIVRSIISKIADTFELVVGASVPNNEIVVLHSPCLAVVPLQVDLEKSAASG